MFDTNKKKEEKVVVVHYSENDILMDCKDFTSLVVSILWVISFGVSLLAMVILILVMVITYYFSILSHQIDQIYKKLK